MNTSGNGTVRAAGARGQHGVVLITVLWVAAMLVLLATALATLTRTEQRLTGNLIAAGQAYHAAEGGVYFAAHRLAGGMEGGTLPWSRPIDSYLIGKVRVSTEIDDERGKVDLNFAPEELIRGVILAVGTGFDAGERLADAILDWRDADSLRRLHGAEDRDYRLEGYRYGAKDGLFDSIEELQRVMGMSAEMYQAVRHAFTVHSRARDINPLAAPALVLRAIPGMTVELVDQFIAARDLSRAQGSPPPPFPVAASPYVTDETGPAYSVNAHAGIPNRTASRIRAVILIEPTGGPETYRIASWNSSPYSRIGGAE